jgi:3-hydroxybutyryl-CoA dehydrogenase
MTLSVLGVVGAGFMGSGIAESAATAGLQVIVHEPAPQQLERSRAGLVASMDRARSRGRVDDEQAAAILGRITHTTQIADLAGADAVVEAIVEELDVKRGVFATLDELLPDARFLASNTSSIPIAELAAVTTRPDRVVGLHFFSPVPVMSLVEVVVALDTSDATRAAATALAEQLGKQPIVTKDRSGFIVNRLLVPYLMAAVRMFEEGFATREDIDEGMVRGCGHPMGPLTLCDFIGLDVLYAVCNSLYEEFKQPEYAPPPLMKRMLAAGRLGRKTGQGFYDYRAAQAAAGGA